ncbi:MAG: DUF4058 family protein [Pirellulaceae bacterium]|nr:DUF4058 family protein [Planctomycetales bacterium]MCA9225449.1 DUF4058 family protein [Planctomycetales bacterium]
MTKENPFPGMNPYLEAYWGDVHTSLTTYARDQLQSQLPGGLRARIEEYVAVESDDDWDGGRNDRGARFAPDVAITERPNAPTPSAQSLGVMSPATTRVIVPTLLEPNTLRTIQIVDPYSGHRVITSIEFLSPANKRSSAGRSQYFAKQQRLMDGKVNMVEIDLIRGGAWMMVVPRERTPRHCREPYRICVIRASQVVQAEMYPAPLQTPLPVVQIPLRPHDQDVFLELQPLINTSYVNGHYSEEIDYRAAPTPPLSDNDAEWAQAWLRKEGVL